MLFSLLVCFFSYDLWKSPVKKQAENCQSVNICGYVKQPVYETSFSSLYIFQLTQSEDQKIFGTEILVTFPPDCAPGLFEYCKGTVTMTVPESEDSSFDMEAYYKSKGIFAMCDGTELEHTGKMATTPDRFFHLFREKLKNYISAYTDGLSEALIRAFLLGDRSLLPDTLKRDLRTLGLSHLLAVSGMHLSILVTFSAFLLKNFRVGLKPRSVCLMLFVLLYMMICGFSVSVVRAGIMLLIYLFSKLVNEKSDSLTALFFSGALIGCFSPFSLFDCGFLMSFLATGGILFAQNLRKNQTNDNHPKLSKLVAPPLDAFIVSLAAQIAVLPVSYSVFGSFSAVSVFSVLLFTPLLTLILYLLPILLVILPLPGLSKLFLTFFGILCRLFATLSSFAEHVKDLQLNISYSFTLPFIALIFLLLAFSLFAEKKKQFVGAISCIYLLFCLFCIFLPYFKEPAVTAAVYKHNDIFIVSSQNNSCLIDLSDGSKKNMKIAVDLLKKEQGDLNPEALLLTHYHQRHTQSFKYLCKNFYPERLYLPIPQKDNENELYIYEELCRIAEEYRVEVFTYDCTTVISPCKGITVSELRKDYIKRSTHPVFSFAISLNEETLRYFSSSAAEIYTVFENESSYFGVHGPVVKTTLTKEQQRGSLLFASKELYDSYGAENGSVFLIPGNPFTEEK